jgi:hypothetical protein
MHAEAGDPAVVMVWLEKAMARGDKKAAALNALPQSR